MPQSACTVFIRSFSCICDFLKRVETYEHISVCLFVAYLASKPTEAEESESLKNTSVEGFPAEVPAVHHDSQVSSIQPPPEA